MASVVASHLTSDRAHTSAIAQAISDAIHRAIFSAIRAPVAKADAVPQPVESDSGANGRRFTKAISIA